jgi:hypothetical protein
MSTERRRIDCADVHDVIRSFFGKGVPNPESDRFLDSVPSRGLLMLDPTSYWLKPTQYQALRSVCVSRDHHGFVVKSLIRTLSGEFIDDCAEHDWRESSEEQTELFTPAENVMVDDAGRWLIVFSSEDFAVIGGEDAVVAGFYQQLGTTSTEETARYLAEYHPPAAVRSLMIEEYMPHRL